MVARPGAGTWPQPHLRPAPGWPAFRGAEGPRSKPKKSTTRSSSSSISSMSCGALRLRENDDAHSRDVEHRRGREELHRFGFGMPALPLNRQGRDSQNWLMLSDVAEIDAGFVMLPEEPGDERLEIRVEIDDSPRG